MPLKVSSDEETSSDGQSSTSSEEDEDEDDGCIIICPSCDESVYYTPAFSPSRRTLRSVRRGGMPPEASRDHVIFEAESAEGEARNLEAEIQRLRALTRKLESRHRKLLKYAEQQRALVPPALRLPFEILHCIFLMACENNVLTAPLDNSVLPVQAITQVCDRWRVIALDDSRMWTPNITLHPDYAPRGYDTIPQADLIAFKKMVSYHLAKSGSQPLSVVLQGIVAYRDYDLLPADFFQQFPRRCQHLTICDDAYAYVAGKYSKSVVMEMLERVEMHDTYHCGRIPGAFASFIKHAPRLTSWNQSIPDAKIIGFPLLVSQLTSLDMNWIDVVWGYNVLAECSALKSLSIYLYITANYSPPSKAIILPHLTELEIFVDPPSILDDLFAAFSAPRLENMHFSSHAVCDVQVTEDWVWPHDKFGAFLNRSGCALTHFHVEYLDMTTEDLCRLREQLPDSAHVYVGL